MGHDNMIFWRNCFAQQLCSSLLLTTLRIPPLFVSNITRKRLATKCMMGECSPNREFDDAQCKPSQMNCNKKQRMNPKAVKLHIDARTFQAGLTAFELGGE